MNTDFPTVTIDVTLDRHRAKEILNALLHPILFRRLFGVVKPQTFEVLDVTMPGVADPEMEQIVTEKMDIFWKGIESGANKRVTFSEKKAKKPWFQVYIVEEDVPWEQWIVNAEMRQPKSDRDKDSSI